VAGAQNGEVGTYMQGTSEDYDAWYMSGMAHYEEGEWRKAYDCFKQAEVRALENASEICKSMDKFESAELYLRRAQKAEQREIRLATPGTKIMRDFFVITGSFALITFILIFVFWPTWAAIFFLILFLIDFLIFVMLLPFVLVKHATSRKKPVSAILFKISLVERQLEEASRRGATKVEQLQIEKLKQKRAKLAQEMVRREYTDSITRVK